MRVSTTLRTLAVVAAMTASLAACGGAEDAADSDATDTPSATATTEATDEPSEDATDEPTDDATEDAAAGSGDVAAPGTTLAIGDKANVPFKSADKKGVISASVVKVDKGSQKDFSVFDKSTRNKLKGYTPYYVRIEISKVSGGELAFSSATESFDAVTGSGEKAQNLAAIGEFKPCDSESFPKDFDKGGSVKTCVIGLVPGGGDPVVGGQYALYGSKYDSYDGKPVLWK